MACCNLRMHSINACVAVASTIQNDVSLELTSRFTTVQTIHIFVDAFILQICPQNQSQFPINPQFVQDACRNTPEHNLTEYDIEQSTQPLWMPDIDKHMIHDPMDLQKYKQRNKIKSSVGYSQRFGARTETNLVTYQRVIWWLVVPSIHKRSQYSLCSKDKHKHGIHADPLQEQEWSPQAPDINLPVKKWMQ